MFNGRPLAVSEARAREDRGPGGPAATRGRFSAGPPGQAGGGFAPRPPARSAVRRDRSIRRRRRAARSRNFGPDAKPQRGGNAKAKKKEAERPRGPIPLKATGRSFTLDDDSPDEVAAGHRRFRDQQADEEDEDAQDGRARRRVNPWERILVALRDLHRRGELPSLVRDDLVRQRLRRSDQRLGRSPSPHAVTSLVHYQDLIDDILITLDRADTHVRFVVTGMDEDDEGNPD